MVELGERPVIFGGAIVAACSWDLAATWPRIVVPDNPSGYRFDFARGLDWLVLARHKHDVAHIAAVVHALRTAGARVVVPVLLPALQK
jgi:hypothetical protein